MTLETCETCGTLDKRGAHDDCQGLPESWHACPRCQNFDDMTSHYCTTSERVNA